jgi:hypothetical protein
MADFWDINLRIRLEAARRARSRADRGRLFEDLICQLFESVEGIAHTERNVFSYGRAQEIDILFFNDRRPGSLDFLPHVIVVECKNWSHPVSSAEVAWFDAKVRQRGRGFGILFAASGVTGDARDLTFAHQIIAWALAEGRELIVITADDLVAVSSVADLIQLLKVKITRLGG